MKKVLLGFALFTCVLKGHSQVEFNHSAGLTYIIVAADEEYTDEYGSEVSSSTVAGYPGITYNPRIDFEIDREMTFSVTAYPTLAFAFNSSYNSRTGGSGSGTFAFKCPVLGQLNFGHHSSSNSRSDFGGYVAAGYDFGRYSGIGTLHGPTAQAGIKFYLRDQSYGLRAEYTKPIGLSGTITKCNVFTLGVLINFER